MPEKSAINKLLKKDVVIYTSSRLSFIGKLEAVDKAYYELSDLAVYDREVVRISLEEYIIEAQQNGITASAKRMLIPYDNVICLTALKDLL